MTTTHAGSVLLPAPAPPSCRRPLLLSTAAAGFPSPAEDARDRTLDLNEHLVANKPATFFMRVAGTSMVAAAINHGDLLIVDRSLRPRDRDIVVAVVDGSLVVKRLCLAGDGGVSLRSECVAGGELVAAAFSEFIIWGVVAHVVHHFRRR